MFLKRKHYLKYQYRLAEEHEKIVSQKKILSTHGLQQNVRPSGTMSANIMQLQKQDQLNNCYQ